jgi:hypothetical protein
LNSRIGVDFIAGDRLTTVDVPAAAEGAWTLSTATPVP